MTKKTTPTARDIRRLINNQKAEHVPHAFRAGGVGMTEFNQLYAALRGLSSVDLIPWMRVIDRMRKTHGPCVACGSKILAYSIIFTRGRLDGLCAHYGELYREMAAHSRPKRDFMSEILASLSPTAEPAQTSTQRRIWREITTEFTLRRGVAGE